MYEVTVEYQSYRKDPSVLLVSSVRQKTAPIAQRFLALLGAILLLPATLLGLAIKLITNRNPIIQEVWKARSKTDRLKLGCLCFYNFNIYMTRQPHYYQGELLDVRIPGFGLKADGIGVAYDTEKKKVYEESWREGLPDGQGTEYFGSGQMLYKGEWNRGVYEGEGIEYFISGQIRYKGQWNYGCLVEGTEYLESGQIKYQGRFPSNYLGSGPRQRAS